MIVKMHLSHQQLAALHAALDSKKNLVDPDRSDKKHVRKVDQFATIISSKAACDGSCPITHYNIELEIRFLREIKMRGDRKKHVRTPRRILDMIWDATETFPIEDES